MRTETAIRADRELLTPYTTLTALRSTRQESAIGASGEEILRPRTAVQIQAPFPHRRRFLGMCQAHSRGELTRWRANPAGSYPGGFYLLLGSLTANHWVMRSNYLLDPGISHSTDLNTVALLSIEHHNFTPGVQHACALSAQSGVI
jgi:hypothetical protein